MTVASTQNRATFAGNGVTTVFAFPYFFIAPSDLIVTLTDSSGNITPQTLTTNYTVSAPPPGNGTYPSGGSVTMGVAPPTGTTLSIIRSPVDTQSTHWVDNDPDPAAVKELAFDKLTLLTQRLFDLVGRSPTLPDGYVGSFNPKLPNTLPANNALAVNSSGTGFTFVPVTTAASGTVTSVGLTMPAELSVSGSPITGAGSFAVSWAAEPANRVFAGPISGGNATPSFRALVAGDLPLSTLAVSAMSSGAASNGQVPVANGVGGIAWQALAGTGTVTSVGISAPSFLSVSGSPITGSGVLSLNLATQTQNSVFAAPSNTNGTPTFRPLVGSDLPIFTGASGVANGVAGAVPQPTAGQQGEFLRGDGTWAAIVAGTVTSVGLAAPVEFTVSGSPVTGSGTLTFSKANQAANTVWAGPGSGGSAAPTFRALVPSDLPVMVGATSGASGVAGAVPAASAGQQAMFLRGDGTWGTSGVGTGTVTSVGLSLPAELTVSGSPVTTNGTLSAVWAAQNANLVFAGPLSGGAAAPGFRSLTGADLPNPSTTSLGGVQSIAAVTSQWIRSISTSGVPALSQPAFSDISGSVASTQMPALSGDVTTSAGATVTSITANAVTNAKLAQMAAGTLKGNNTGGTANAADLTVAQVNTLLLGMTTLGDLVYGGASGAVTRLAGNTTAAKQFLTQTGTGAVSAAPGWAAIVAGDIPSLDASKITTGSFPLTQIASIASNTILGNNTGSSAAPSALTAAQVNTLLGSLSNPMTTAGDMIYGGASGLATRLANGTVGQYLKSAGGTSAPVWTSFPRSQITVTAVAGYGSTNTAILVWNATTVVSTGTDITRASSAAAGDSFTINTDGIYTISCTIRASAAGQFGFIRNTSGTVLTQGASAFSVVANNGYIFFGCYVSGGLPNAASWTGFLAATDVIRIGSDTGFTFSTSTMTITKVSN